MGAGGFEPPNTNVRGFTIPNRDDVSNSSAMTYKQMEDWYV